jgi:6-phosphofructokinase 1
MHSITHEDLDVKVLGNRTVKSPLRPSLHPDDDLLFGLMEKTDRVLFNSSLEHFKHCYEAGETPLSFEMAGPHKVLFFDPAKTRVAIVTCGGICPGLNNVIRGIVNELHYRYNVKQIIGIQSF